MYFVKRAKAFERSFKRLRYSGTKEGLKKEIAQVIDLLAAGKSLPGKYRDHKLAGPFEGYRECHIRPDLLLIYQVQKDALILLLLKIGSHAELFE